ncbi:MAG: hypothetical protein H0X31_02180 [Nostocaceae cyanobacterium]|nr:hypothetical protein [Nostocaceae cyanobacterium]
MVLQRIVLSLLTTAAIIATSNMAMADSLVSSGTGGDYKYQLWRSTDNTQYYIKVWQSDSDLHDYPRSTTRSFESSREALDYFDCVYAHKHIPSCPS